MNKDGIGLSQYVALLALVIISTIYIYPNISRNNITNESAIITFEETPSEIIRGDISKKQVIYTFDGGGGSQSAKAILDTLKKHNVKSTFFLTGKFIEDNQEIVKRMISEKHEIFNHTYDHPYLTQLPEGRIAQELQMMDSEYQKISGV
ncbi:MAG: polysaccharide deacetylase family protein, partial [Patescibacteria group bacterium]